MRISDCGIKNNGFLSIRIPHGAGRSCKGEKVTKRLLTLALAGSLLNLFAAGPVCAETQAEKEARFALKVKAGVRKLGTGEKARIKVRLKDKTRVKGYVSATGED